MKWKRSFLTFFIVQLVILNHAVPFSPAKTSQDNIVRVGKYELFEANFISDSIYANPYVEVKLDVQVSGPAGIEFIVAGYWDEHNTWKVRIMPTEVGAWHYVANSNDPGLNGISGEFECISSSRLGMLGVNPDHPYTFQLSEGNPFFWMGETSWWLMSKDVGLLDGTFKKLITKRREQKFNGIHFVLGTGGAPSSTQNPENEGGKLWFSQRDQRVNPQFFHWMDKRITYLDSVQMAIGFFITWSQHFTTFTRDDFERFERYLIARYNAYPLLYWIIVGEFDEAGKYEDYNYHGRVIDEVDPYGHLISIHPNHHDAKNLGTNRIFANQTWCDMIIQQLPQYPVWISYDDVYKSILLDRTYGKPVANVEYGYENKDYSGKIVTGDWMRRYAWSIVCAGGFFSYGHDETIRTVNIEALESDGAQYMGYLFDFFQNIEWWKMNPDTASVSYGYCLSGPANEFVIYLPDSNKTSIDLSQKSGTFQALWYNPIDGSYSNITEFEGGSVQSFYSDFDHDAVLHIRELKIPPLYQITGGVTYYQDNGSVAEANLDLAYDGITVSDTTGSNGLFEFVNIAEKYYKLTPQKIGDHREAITGNDALLVLQHLAIQADLTDDQKLAADMTRDNKVAVSDFLAIMSYLTFSNDQMASAGEWKFDPDSIFFWLNKDTIINFKACLLGDVNGNWGSEKTVTGTGDHADTTAIILSLARTNAHSARQFSIPVSIDNLDIPLQTLVFSITYNPSILKFISAIKKDLSDPFILVANGTLPGSIHLALIGVHEISQPGEIIELCFENINKNYRIFSTDIEIKKARINDLKVTKFNNGKVILGKPKYVDTAAEIDFVKNYPNPFNSGTTILLNLANEKEVKILIYNTLGQIVNVLCETKLKAGNHEIKWNGENDRGEAAPSGVYFYRIEAIDLSGPEKATKTIMNKMILIR